MKKALLLFFTICTFMGALAHGFDESIDSLVVDNQAIIGTLTMPAHADKAIPLVIIIAGSGPTDRDCNGQGFRSDAYKKVAASLAMKRIACYRYDKRGVGKSVNQSMREEEFRFDMMVKDAQAIIEKYKKDKRFSEVTVLGHSEGSLVAMLACDTKTPCISLAGAGINAAEILKKQLKGQLGEMEETVFKKIDSVRNGETVVADNPVLMQLLRPSVQSYMHSWMVYDPAKEIKKFKGKFLIINGTKDLQVPVEHATKLHDANNKASLLLIDNMNHILTEIEGGTDDNIASYNKPELPISTKLIDAISSFIVQ
ncbi:MAG: alpha/beta hydrolase [Chitinophagaceae bacterium]